jgi:hypothetical protein
MFLEPDFTKLARLARYPTQVTLECLTDDITSKLHLHRPDLSTVIVILLQH